ncbi:RICIN domain-containing protein [Turicibacter sanguinis]|uniref:RICIN domain-containing protein n=1 Tax=Turicibacter sanguinis TaxID=154288 RepID=UPI0018A8C9F0|nr:RICIN domain-containing protein [Turicibacter sanguinis]MDB8553026.1 RICIN domain-containing protein [Turicibacter sanguinis]
MKRVFMVLIFTLLVIPVWSEQVEVHAATKTYGDGIVRTIQFGGQNLYLDIATDKNAFARSKSGASSQNVYFEFHPDKNAYKIYLASNPDLILAWNDYFYSTNVFFTNDGDLDEHYWVLEEEPSSNIYHLRNYKKNDGYGYLTALNSQGFMNVAISGKNNYVNHYTSLTISSGLRNADVIDGYAKRLVSVAEPKKSLNKDITSHNVSIADTNLVEKQRILFTYDSSKDAYTISNVDENWVWRALTWDNDNGDNVIMRTDAKLDNQYWRLEDIGGGNYIIKSYKNPNKVLDLKYLSSTSIDVRVSDRTNSTTQQFRLENY